MLNLPGSVEIGNPSTEQDQEPAQSLQGKSTFCIYIFYSNLASCFYILCIYTYIIMSILCICHLFHVKFSLYSGIFALK